MRRQLEKFDNFEMVVSRSGEEVLSAFNTTINEKILTKLPTLFKKIPSMRLELVEESVGI